MLKKTGLIWWLTVGLVFGFAQEGTPQNLEEVHDNAMKKLAFLAGEWQPKALSFNPETKAWEPKAIHSEHGDTVKVEAMSTTRGLRISIPGETAYIGAVSYDVFQKRYRMVFLDSAMGLIDVYEGAFDGDELHMSNLASGTHFQHLGQTFSSRLKFKPQPGKGWKLVVEMSADQGTNWFEAYKLFTTPVS